MNVSNSYIRDDVRRFLSAMENAENGFVPDENAAEARTAFAAMLATHDAAPRDLTTIRDLSCPGPAGPILLRLYDAQDTSETRPAITYFHGGGFIMGNRDCYAALCSEIAALTGLPVVAVDYRLAPEHPFPAAPDDCEAAARWIAGQPVELGVPVSGLIAMGDSAGGNLAIVTAQALAARPAALPVVLQVPVYPLAGPIARHESYRAFRHGHLLTREGLARFHAAYAAPLDDPRHYPVLHPAHGKAPPTLLITAELDPLRDSGREYGAKLAEAGIDCRMLEIPGMVHGFMTLRRAIPSAQGDLETILATMAQMLERHS